MTERIRVMELPDIKEIIPGAIGSFGAAALWLRGPWGRRLTMATLGAAASYYGAPYVAKTLSLSEGFAGFMLGLFGMSVVDSIFKTWHDRGLTAMIREFASALRGKE